MEVKASSLFEKIY